MAAKKSTAKKSSNPKVKKAVPRRPAAKKASVKATPAKKPSLNVEAIEAIASAAGKEAPVQPAKRGPGRPAGSGKGKKGAGRPAAHASSHWMFALLPVVEDDLGLEDDSASAGPVKIEYQGPYDTEETAIDAALASMGDRTDLRVSLARDYRVGRIEVKRRLI